MKKYIIEQQNNAVIVLTYELFLYIILTIYNQLKELIIHVHVLMMQQDLTDTNTRVCNAI